MEPFNLFQPTTNVTTFMSTPSIHSHTHIQTHISKTNVCMHRGPTYNKVRYNSTPMCGKRHEVPIATSCENETNT